MVSWPRPCAPRAREGQLATLCASDRPDGNCHSGDCVRGCQHVATTIENSSRIDHHARRVNFAGHDALRLDLDAPFGKDHSVKAARNHHAISFDLTLDLSALSKDHRLLRDNVSLDVPVDAERPFDIQGSFKRYALVYESCPLLDSVSGGCRPLPSHEVPPM